MAKVLEALNSLFSSPEYADRIPESVREKIAKNGFGQDTFTQVEMNAMFDVLVNKFAKQDLYSYTFHDIDLTRFDKGYVPYGDIMEDDFIDIASAREFPALEEGKSVDPFVIRYPTVKPSYYLGTYELQYWVTTRTMEMKKAFMSERNVDSFIERARGVLPESLKMDRYLIFRAMLSNMDYAKTITCKVSSGEDDNFMSMMTPEQAQEIMYNIAMASTAMAKTSTAWNKQGVMNATPKDRQVLIINAGVYELIKSVLYNSYHDQMRFGFDESQIIKISGFGKDAAADGLFAVIIDETAFKAYTTENPDMESIYNPAGKYWNTWLTYQGKLGYALHACSAKFVLTDAE